MELFFCPMRVVKILNLLWARRSAKLALKTNPYLNDPTAMTSPFHRRRVRREISPHLGRSSNRSESRSARRVRDRRNMIVALYLGHPIMFLGVIASVFHFRVFSDSTETAIGLFMILASYGVVILGCSWWLRAKGWDQAVLLIGLLPMLSVLIPGLRLAVRNPIILWGSMVFMSMLLAVVIFSLPDRS